MDASETPSHANDGLVLGTGKVAGDLEEKPISHVPAILEKATL
jgi:hypothetical protein